MIITVCIPDPPQRQAELKDELSDIVKQVCEKYVPTSRNTHRERLSCWCVSPITLLSLQVSQGEQEAAVEAL